MIRAAVLPIGKPTLAGRIYPQEVVEHIIATSMAATRRHVVFDNDASLEIKPGTIAGILERMQIEGDELIAYYHTLDNEIGLELAALVACSFPILYTPVCTGGITSQNVVSNAQYHFLNAYFKGEG